MLRDQKDDLEVRLATTNEARFSRLSGKMTISRIRVRFDLWAQSKVKRENPSLYFLLDLDNNTSERLRVEEGIKLKENIIQVYRKQIDARRSLLEIDSGLMDIVHEQTRNENVVQQ